MGEQRCAGRWGTPVGLQLHGLLLLLLLLWMASMAFLHRPVCYRLPPCRWEHRLSHCSCLKKGPMCTGQTTSKWHLLCLAGASSFPGTCLQPCCSATLWGHLPPAPGLNMACGPVIICQLCFSTAL